MKQNHRGGAIRKAKDIIVLNPFFLGTKTTGISDDDEIIEISILDNEGRVLLDRRIKPLKTIPPNAIKVHGITNQMVSNSPPWHDIWPEVQSILAYRFVAIYNADYDLRMLIQTTEKSGFDWVPPYSDFFCIMKLFAQYIGEGDDLHGDYKRHNIEFAGNYFMVNIPNYRQAIDDALLAREILLSISENQKIVATKSKVNINEKITTFIKGIIENHPQNKLLIRDAINSLRCILSIDDDIAEIILNAAQVSNQEILGFSVLITIENNSYAKELIPKIETDFENYFLDSQKGFLLGLEKLHLTKKVLEYYLKIATKATYSNDIRIFAIEQLVRFEKHGDIATNSLKLLSSDILESCGLINSDKLSPASYHSIGGDDLQKISLIFGKVGLFDEAADILVLILNSKASVTLGYRGDFDNTISLLFEKYKRFNIDGRLEQALLKYANNRNVQILDKVGILNILSVELGDSLGNYVFDTLLEEYEIAKVQKLDFEKLEGDFRKNDVLRYKDKPLSITDYLPSSGGWHDVFLPELAQSSGNDYYQEVDNYKSLISSPGAQDYRKGMLATLLTANKISRPIEGLNILLIKFIRDKKNDVESKLWAFGELSELDGSLATFQLLDEIEENNLHLDKNNFYILAFKIFIGFQGNNLSIAKTETHRYLNLLSKYSEARNLSSGLGGLLNLWNNFNDTNIFIEFLAETPPLESILYDKIISFIDIDDNEQVEAILDNPKLDPAFQVLVCKSFLCS